MGNAQTNGSTPCGDERAVQVTVTVIRKEGAISVVPDTVTIYKDGGPGKYLRVCWTITGMVEGDTLTFEDKGTEQPDYFPAMPRTVAYPESAVSSGNPALTGTWTYSVVVKDKTGKTVAIKDPKTITVPGP